MPLLTSSETATVIADRTGLRPTRKALNTWAKTGILTNHSTGTHRRFDVDELAEFLAAYPYRPQLPFPYLGVSLTELQRAPAFELAAPHGQWREWGGYDHLNRDGLDPLQRARAIVSTWRINPDHAQEILDRGLPIIGTISGVITPDTIYYPRAVVRLVGGIGFDVDPDRRGHDAIGTGAITDVTPGNMWRVVEASTESGQ